MKTKVTLAQVKNANYNELRKIAKELNFNAGKNPKADDLRQALELLVGESKEESNCSVLLSSLSVGDRFRFRTSDTVHTLSKLETMETLLKVETERGRKWSDKLDCKVVKVS